ncbi:MAG: hypothetical protein JW744_00685 [Candidatus Diapherotrites archaeon]|uniref:Uncharacterized protein n=1 Tax=Candidatus Iainarchaeum sp. TaxID=3101447 RepID=A0A938YVQ1_9ARCH|nr:hypothetical protein [Candidatus Diapherotrites archaeon]
MSLSNEEIAARIVKIYFREIARLGYKRQLTLDETINAYYYVLSRLGNKGKELENAKAKVIKDESDLETESKEEILPQARETVTTTKTTETTTKVQE